MTPDQWTKIKYFKPDEILRPEFMRLDMMLKVDQVCEYFGRPLIISSSLRFRRSVDEKDSAHFVDPVSGFYSGLDLTTAGNIITPADAWLLDVIARTVGFRRIGIYPKHIHLDIESRLPQDVLWIGMDRK